MPFRKFQLASSVLLTTGAAMAAAKPILLMLGPTGYREAGPLLLAAIFGLVPYVVCAIVWLPRRSLRAQRNFTVIASMLLVATAVMYVPVLASGRGDMIFVVFMAYPAILLVGTLIHSGLVIVHMRSSGGGGVA